MIILPPTKSASPPSFTTAVNSYNGRSGIDKNVDAKLEYFVAEGVLIADVRKVVVVAILLIIIEYWITAMRVRSIPNRTHHGYFMPSSMKI